MQRNDSKTKIMVEGALMIALATVLGFIKLFELPQGGTISLEMLPLLLMGLRRGTKWGLGTGFVHGFIQMVLGFSNVLYCATLASQLGCILLDYLVAYTVMGLAGAFALPFGRNSVGVGIGCVCSCALRFVCHFISGMWLWGAYAPADQPVWLYSFVYNGSYMLVDTVIVTVVLLLLRKAAPKLLERG